MLARSEKIEPKEVLENPCPECDGAGQRLMIPYGNAPAFFISCSYCFGDKIISEDLKARKAKAVILKEMLRDLDLTTREAAQKFSQKFLDWNDARIGRAKLEVIEEKIGLLKSL